MIVNNVIRLNTRKDDSFLYASDHVPLAEISIHIDQIKNDKMREVMFFAYLSCLAMEFDSAEQ